MLLRKVGKFVSENKEKKYRRNVAAVVVNSDGQILACQRSDVRGAWQLPQGGIDDAETAQEALLRELEEEIGTSEVEILAQLPEPIRYDWPIELHKRGHIGQEQTYFLVRPIKETSLQQFRKDGEFNSYEWVSLAEFLSRLSGFKKDAYIKALSLLSKNYPQFIKS